MPRKKNILGQEALQLIKIDQFSYYHHSNLLEREVRIDFFTPSDYADNDETYPIIYFNDGQDMPRIKLVESLQEMIEAGSIPPVIIAAVHASYNRMQEYGVSAQADYAGRGSRAGLYTRFVMEELLAFTQQHFRITQEREKRIFAGFSLGGLMAFDIVWHQASHFGKVGVFSGSFWWRSKPVEAHDPDANRIMHDILYRSQKREGLKFWLQTGTEDEKEDRNNNGVIDSIDDTLDIIRALRYLGYEQEEVHYVEVGGGKHHPKTWALVLPDFLKWCLN